MLKVFAFFIFFCQGDKLPVPGQAEQKKAETELKSLFRDSFSASAKERSEKAVLAGKLLEQASDEKNPPVARYVALRLSRDLATEALDLETAFLAIERMDRYFDLGFAALTGATFAVERNSWKAVALGVARKYAASPEDVMTLTDAYLKLASEVLSEKNFPDALSAAHLAEQYAKLGKSPAALEKAASMAREIPELKKEDEQFGAAITSKADDAQARLVKGRVALFVVKDEGVGIDMLIGCSDEGVSAAAKLEKAVPVSTGDMLKIAENWLSLSKRENNPLHKRRYFERSLLWFESALKSAGGLDKIKIEARLAEIEAKSGKPTTLNLLRTVKVSDAIQGKPWECSGEKIITPAGGYDRIQVPYEPGEEYVVTVVAQKKKGDNALYLGLVGDGCHFVMFLDGGPAGNASAVDGVGGKTSVANETSYKGKIFQDERPRTIVITVRRANFLVTVDGKKVIDWKNPDYKKIAVHPVVSSPNPKAMSIGTFQTEFHILQMTLLPTLGRGKPLR